AGQVVAAVDAAIIGHIHLQTGAVERSEDPPSVLLEPADLNLHLSQRLSPRIGHTPSDDAATIYLDVNVFDVFALRHLDRFATRATPLFPALDKSRPHRIHLLPP